MPENARERDVGPACAASSEMRALERLYDEYAAPVYGYVRLLGAAPSLAEDIVQEVFLRMVRQRVRPEFLSDARAFLFTVARREFFRWKTRFLRRRETSLAVTGDVFESRATGISADAIIVADALAALPLQQREVVSLKTYAGLTFDQIASVTGASPNTVASRYRYALAKLKGLLADKEP